MATVEGDLRARQGGKFLTFVLAGEEYGLEILKVHEIIGLVQVTRVPRTPDFVLGVINLRGMVIPIVDLRRKFGLEDATGTAESCTIVVQVAGVQIGLQVDKVSEVVDIAGADVEDAPSFGAGADTDYLLGLAKTAGRVRLLLNIDQVLGAGDIVRLSEVVESAAQRA